MIKVTRFIKPQAVPQDKYKFRFFKITFGRDVAEDYAFLNNSKKWVKIDDLPDELITEIEDASAAIFFKTENKELLGNPNNPTEATEFFNQLESQKVIVGTQTSSFPGFPYFEALIALIPAGATLVVLKGIRDLILAWLQGRNDREVEIKLTDGSSIRLKGANATRKTVESIVTSLNASPKQKKSGSKRSSGKKLTKKASPKALKGKSRKN